jgi:hypothetical protein
MKTRFFRRAAFCARTQAAPASRLPTSSVVLTRDSHFSRVNICLWPLAARRFLNTHKKHLVGFLYSEVIGYPFIISPL